MPNNNDVEYLAKKIRKDFGEDENSPVQVFSLVQSIENLTLVEMALSNSISGMCIKKGKKFVIVINSDITIGRRNFTLAHELYHLYFGKESFIICDKKISTSSNEEVRANLFASNFLMPDYALRNRINNRKIDLDILLDLENYFQISRECLLTRLKKDKFITGDEVEKYNKNIVVTAMEYGYPKELYIHEKKNNVTQGDYIKTAKRLYESGKISKGKYEEYLLDAFRDDIVFGKFDEDKYD